MAKDDTSQYSMDDLIAMRERGDYVPTRPDAPTFEPDEEFWQNARLVTPKNKATISLRIDAEVLEWFKAQGKGHLTRMNTVLRSYVEAHKQQPKPPGGQR
jgi:uncharacterized protein (DUF4415 family)